MATHPIRVHLDVDTRPYIAAMAAARSTTMSSKWSKAYWQDLAERVGSSAVAGALTALTVNGTTNVHVTAQVVETLILVPSAVALLKGLLVNLGDSSSGSASMVGTSSTKKRKA